MVGLMAAKQPELPLRKAWRIATDNPELIKVFQTRVCTGDHQHAICEAGNAEPSGYYLPEMARMILMSYKRIDVQKLVNQVKRNTGAAIMAATVEEKEEFEKLTVKEQNSLISAAKKIHQNTSHRPPAELAKNLRESGAPPAARAAMEKVKCDSCEENMTPQPAAVATIDTSRVPFQVIGIDIKVTLMEKQKTNGW